MPLLLTDVCSHLRKRFCSTEGTTKQNLLAANGEEGYFIGRKPKPLTGFVVFRFFFFFAAEKYIFTRLELVEELGKNIFFCGKKKKKKKRKTSKPVKGLGFRHRLQQFVQEISSASLRANQTKSTWCKLRRRAERQPVFIKFVRRQFSAVCSELASGAANCDPENWRERAQVTAFYVCSHLRKRFCSTEGTTKQNLLAADGEEGYRNI